MERLTLAQMFARPEYNAEAWAMLLCIVLPVFAFFLFMIHVVVKSNEKK